MCVYVGMYVYKETHWLSKKKQEFNSRTQDSVNERPGKVTVATGNEVATAREKPC